MEDNIKKLLIKLVKIDSENDNMELAFLLSNICVEIANNTTDKKLEKRIDKVFKSLLSLGSID